MTLSFPISKQFITKLGLVCIFSTLAILIYHAPFFSGSLPLGYDTEIGFLHAKHLLRTYLAKNWSIPFWNPFSFCGTPFLGNIQVYIFYLPEILTLIFQPAFGITVSSIFHHIIAGIFTFLLCRSFGIQYAGSIIGGLAYSFYPWIFPIVLSYGSITVSHTASWLPLVIYAAKKTIDSGNFRYSILTGCVIALQILAGNPEIAFISQVCLICYVLIYSLPTISAGTYHVLGKRIAFIAASFIIGYSLAGIQLAPTWELAVNSNRSSGVSLQTAGTHSVGLMNFLEYFILPSLAHKGFQWLPIGIGNFIVVIFFLTFLSTIWPRPSRNFLIIWILLLISLFISIGRYNPLFPFVHNLPGFRLFRNTQYWLMIAHLSISILTGGGIEGVFSSLREKIKFYRIYRLISIFVSLGCIIAAIFVLLMGRQSIAKGLLSWGICAAIFLCILYWTHSHRIKNFHAQWLIIIILSIDLLLYGQHFISSSKTPNRLAAIRKAFDSILPKTPDPYRLMTVGQTYPYPHEGASLGLHTADGLDSLIIRKYAEFITRTVYPTDKPLDDLHLIWVEDYTNKFADLLNIRMILSPYDLKDKKLVLRYINSVRVYENVEALPRAFMVDRILFKNEAEIIPYMISPQFDPKKEVIMDEDVHEEISRLGFIPPPKTVEAREKPSSSKVRFIKYNNDDILINVKTANEGVLVLSDVYFPGWIVQVDGTEDKIYEVNYCFRGVYLTQGSHQVRFSYRPRSFWIGLGISLFGTLFCIGGYFISERYKLNIRHDQHEGTC